MCTSADPRDRRTRHSLLIEGAGRRLLVDTPPELRLQLLRARVRHLDAVFISHTHADHTHGVDDLRIFSLRSTDALPLYIASEYAGELMRRFEYIWGQDEEAARWHVTPDLDLRTFEDREAIDAGGFALLPVAFPHGYRSSYGFRLDDLAVIVDAKQVPPDALPLLDGVRVLVVNALWFGNPHPSHFNVEEAIEAARLLGAERTYLTHLSHRLEHEALEQRLPDGVFAAYDGLVIDV